MIISVFTKCGEVINEVTDQTREEIDAIVMEAWTKNVAGTLLIGNSTICTNAIEAIEYNVERL